MYNSSHDKLIIIGASGHGKVAADIALKMNKWASIAFLDDNEDIKSALGISVVGKASEAIDYSDNWDIFVAIGNNETRERIQNELEIAGANIPILVHPTAVIGEEVEIGQGSIIMAGAVINCCSKIGNGCIVNTAATIDHDNIIEDYVHISPGAHLAGTVKVCKRTWIGIGAVISNNLGITNNCIIGAGSVVIKDICETGFYAGVPVRKLS